MKVIAKFQCIDNAPVEGEQKRMFAIPVTSGSEENKSFSRWTPAGQLELIISNETEAADFLQPGDEFYLTIEKCHQNPNFAASETQPDVEDLAPEGDTEEIEEQEDSEEIEEQEDSEEIEAQEGDEIHHENGKTYRFTSGSWLPVTEEP